MIRYTLSPQQYAELRNTGAGAEAIVEATLGPLQPHERVYPYNDIDHITLYIKPSVFCRCIDVYQS